MLASNLIEWQLPILEMGDPVEAMAWAESLGTEEQYAPVVAYMFQDWYRSDAPRATTALMGFRRGLARDRALRRMVAVRLAAYDTMAAEQFFHAIESPGERRSAAGRLHWYYTEPTRSNARRRCPEGWPPKRIERSDPIRRG